MTDTKSSYTPIPAAGGSLTITWYQNYLWRSLLLVLMLLVFSEAAAQVEGQIRQADAGQPSKSHVLLLNSYHQGFRWTDDITTSIVSTLTASQKPIELHIEYMDTKRLNNEQLLASLEQLLALKYQERQPDLIILSDDDALMFMKQYHQKLYPGVPVVFCGINSVHSTLDLPKEMFTGIIETLDISDNIKIVTQLFPNTSEIVIVSDGTPTGRGTRQMAVEAQPDYPGINFTYLNGETLGTDEMLARLKALPKNSVVIAPAWYKDRDGEVFDNTDIYPLIADASPVPVIATSSANLGLGLFGGKVNSGITQGRFAADQALRILTGQSVPLNIPVETASHNQFMFDSRQLIRFGVEERELPSGSIVLHRSFSFYQTYWYLVWSIIAAFFLFTVMIIVLLINLNRLSDARNNLIRSEENLRITLHSIGDAVISTDIKGRITRLNPVAESLTGWPVAEALGKPLPEVLHLVHGGTRELCQSPVDIILAASDITTLEKDTILISKSGDEYRVADSGAPIRNTNNEVIGIVLVFRDITEEFLRENQRNQSRKLEAIGQLAGGIAHDFNNMLGGIIGSAEILGMHLGLKSPLQKYIATILKASENASALTGKLLAFSRKGTMTFTAMDVHSAIINAQSMLEHSLDRNIIIKRDFKAVASTIDGDSSQIENSIINLCINAAQAMTEGGVVTITTENVALDEASCQANPFAIVPGFYVQIGIQDTGEGIPPELLEQIFDPFFTTKEVGKGTGLGLSAVHGIIRDHHGSISVYSEVGVGTVFYLFLPVGKTVPVQTSEQDDLLESGSGCILLIDDEQVIRTSISFILEHLGYQVMLAGDGQEGVAAYKAHHEQIDLVLLDMIMPRMGGIACLKEIRAVNPKAKVLISSGFAKEGGLEELEQLGIMGFIRKPYRRIDLARAVAQAMRQAPNG